MVGEHKELGHFSLMIIAISVRLGLIMLSFVFAWRRIFE